ncbi:MAG TPA: 4a-hydroxytetrahydrobiopterin dehydratase [Verrucomicrobiales bacterium]|nr:4a-hydroxytetrahydrobiopterin dehydratase [Verrucomicrobiales bacterium]
MRKRPSSRRVTKATPLPEADAARRLSAREARSRLQGLGGWTLKGGGIRKAYEFGDFLAAMRFVNRVASAAERACHHPDIDIRWNRVLLTLTTHDAGGLTSRDFALAGSCDRLAAAIS